MSRKKVLHSSQSSVYKRLWKHQHLQESRKKTLHSEQLQSARDCWSRSISKRGKCQERRFYTAAKAQSTRDCRRVNISKGDKHYVTRKKILHSSPSSVFNRQSSSKHQASRLQQNLNFRHQKQSREVQWRPVGTSSSTSARAEECSGGQWGPPPSPGTASRSRGPSWSRSGSCRGSSSKAAVNKAADFKTLKNF